MTNKIKKRERNHDNPTENDVILLDDYVPVPRLSINQASIIVILTSCLCFWKCQYAEFTFDDNSAILSNKDVSAETPLWSILENDFWGTKMSSKLSHKSYRPLTVLTYRVNYILSGGYHPWSFHVVNLVLHSLNCVLLLRVFSLFFGGVSDNDIGDFKAPRRSLLATLLFTVHPVHTESVAAVVGRADLICSIFFNFSLLFYIKHSYEDQQAGWKGRKITFIVSMLCAIIAMFSKEQGITVLGVCLAYDVIMVLRLNLDVLKKKCFESVIDLPSIIKRMVIVCIIAFGLLVIRLNIMGNVPPSFQKMDNPASFHPSLIFRVFNYIYLYSINVWLLLAPYWLCFDWAMGCIPVITSYDDVRLLFPLLLVVGVTLLLMKIIFNLDRPSGRLLMMSFCLLVIPFLPAMNIFFRVGFVIAERNLYIPSIGFSMLIVHGVNAICKSSAGRKISKIGIACVMVIFISRTINRTNNWLTEESLFKSGEEVCPLNAKVHYNIGKVSQDKNELDNAIRYYKNAIRLSPEYDQPMNNLGNILKDMKQYKEAEFYLQNAVNVTPKFATGWMNLGIVKAEMNKNDEANECYSKAVLHRRNYPDAYYNWGNMFLALKKHQEALEKFEKAISLKHDHLQAWQNKINLLCEMTNEDLLKGIQKMASIFPTNDQLMYLAGNSLGRVGNFKESKNYLLRTIKLNQRNYEAHGALGAVYHHTKDYKEAEKHYKISLSINPNHQGTIANYKKLQKTMQKK
ncbi:protein O-mannosyl-transferase TMTC4-like isoform X2 [Clytia hemisphaerica]|uniref:protein O-mannosyl-transferase TMTC4-like isoform X2 n=1 Tax=Clytia hemisphaerica TaxID=252671 RepID=UPI0034D3D0D3